MTYLARADRSLAGLGAADWSQLAKDIGGVAATQAAEAVASHQDYLINRARAAAVVDLGYGTIDQFNAARPLIFAGSLVTLAASLFGLYKRRKVPEAVALYSLTSAISAAAAWVTKPNLVSGTPAPTPPATNAQAPSALKSALGWADRRAERLSREQPGWERRTLARLWGDLGTGTMAPAVDVLISKNSH